MSGTVPLPPPAPPPPEEEFYPCGMRDELKVSWQNFRNYDAPLATKMRMAIANNLKKARTRQSCCGNLGQPGC